MSFKIEKNQWKQVRLDDIVEWYQKDIPNNKQILLDIENYITAEHIESDVIKITRSGLVKSGKKGPTITKHYQKGDLLLSTRSVALRKASITQNEGVTGEKLLVLRPKKNSELIVELFPFIFKSSHFWNFAQNSAAGSVNKFTSWTKIKEYQFLLPPKDQQAKIAKLLWAMDDVVEKEKDVLDEIQSAYQVILENAFSDNGKFQLHKLKNLATINEESLKASKESDYEFKYLDIASIEEPKIIGEMKKMKFADAPSRARRILKDGSIVLSLVRPYHKAFVLVENSENIISSTGTAVINTNSGVNNHFLFHQFFSNRFQLFCDAMMTGTNYPAITPFDLKEYKLYFCDSLDDQNKIASKLDSFDNSIVIVNASIQNSKQLQKSLINEIFSV